MNKKMKINKTIQKKEKKEIFIIKKSKSAISIIKKKTIEHYSKKKDSINDKINIKYKRMKSFDEKLEKEIKKNTDLENKLITSIKNTENINKEDLDLANSINYKSIPDKIIETDEFGFLKSKIKSEKKEEKKEDKHKNDLLINSRTEKWIYMLEHYDTFIKSKFSKLKKRTRKGIPDNLRSNVWQLFAEIKKYYKKGLYQELIKQKIDAKTEDIILKDLDRTYPSCQLFSEKYGGGQRKLYNVLSCFSKYQKEIGYIQGMSFLSALFLTYMDEESAFFMLNSLMDKYEMKRIFSPGFPDVRKIFYVLLNLQKKFIPKIYEVLKNDSILPSLYATEWFLCLFSKELKFNFVVRIFDTFLLEGFKVIYRFALGIFKLKEKLFIESKSVAETMEIIRKPINDSDLDNLFEIAFGFSLSRELIKKIEKEYDINKDNDNNEFISQL